MVGKERPIRVGVVGVRRGQSFARGAGPHLGMELVALCDVWEARLRQVGTELGVATYTDYERFLEHDLDAVILANFFHQHTPFAVKALRAGKHVMSETSACFTMAQAVELIETVEQTRQVYVFAENYPYMRHNQEMRRLYQAGEIGTFKYGEGEYVHPFSALARNRLAPGVDHWRNWLPVTYYNTHALAPIMFITDTWPVKVNGFVVPYDEEDPQQRYTARRQDTASMIAVRMDNGAVAKLLQGQLRGEGNWVRIHGSRGLMENLRSERFGERTAIRLRREGYDMGQEQPEERVYLPEFPAYGSAAARAGHGGGDFFTNYHFARAIRGEEAPFWDVYRGVAASIVGILAYRSALQDGNTVEVPDLRQPALREPYRHDHWSPDPATRREGDPWPSIRGEMKPSAEGLAYARTVWAELGYAEDRGLRSE
ncbi:MAG TPA: Gfo/Idh/MocA family oxidoreductase [Chloroflexota bacterium]|nr:Gfo/Idh/MocA family oxidoreductase [Chloroflexota bacterium]